MSKTVNAVESVIAETNSDLVKISDGYIVPELNVTGNGIIKLFGAIVYDTKTESTDASYMKMVIRMRVNRVIESVKSWRLLSD